MFSQRFLQISLGLVFVLFSLFYQIDHANAAQIKKIKGKKVLITLDGDAASPGDTFYAVTSSGKKRAIIKITKSKGDKAIGKILKGKAKKGYSLKARGGKKRNKSKTAKSGSGGSKGSFYGGMAGVNSSSMDSINEITGDVDTSMSGMGFSAKALFDYQVFSGLWFRGLGGLEMFSVSSADEICGAGDDEKCEASINYLSLDLWGRYVFGSGSFRPWGGLGFILMFPATKDSTAITDSSISSTSLIAVGGGADWYLSNSTYVPIQIEYAMFPDSKTVEATMINIRAGIAWGF